MKSFVANGRSFRFVKVARQGGERVNRGTGTADPVTADYMADMCEVLASKHAWDVLNRITGTATQKATHAVPEIYALWSLAPTRINPRTQRPDELTNDARLEFVRSRLTIVDLDVVVERWAQRQETNERYVDQVRKLIPRGTFNEDGEKVSGPVFPLTDYTFQNLAEHLKVGLTVAPPTRRRYKVAHTAFCEFLMEASLMELNLARGVRFKRVDREHRVALSMDEARRVVESLDGSEQRALEAMMAGCGVERGACHIMRRRDIDLQRKLIKVHPHLTGKNKYRSRTIEVTEDWAWAIVLEHVRFMTPDALVFPHCESEAGALIQREFGKATVNPRAKGGQRSMAPTRRHQRACRRLRLPITTLHDYRHTYAITWIRRGILGGVMWNGVMRSLNWLRKQLGHAPNSTLILTTYGVEIDQWQAEREVDAREVKTG